MRINNRHHPTLATGETTLIIISLAFKGTHGHASSIIDMLNNLSSKKVSNSRPQT